MKKGKEYVKKVVSDRLELLGSAGKAWN
jgi:hypothetical protein